MRKVVPETDTTINKNSNDSHNTADDNLNTKEPRVVLKTMSLKRKLYLSFILVTALSIILTTSFAMIYFVGKIRNEATDRMRTNLRVSQLVYERSLDEAVNFADTLANDKTLQILTDLKIENKLSAYLEEILKRKNEYAITILDSKGKPMASLAIEGSPLETNREELDFSTNALFLSALGGVSQSSSELIKFADGRKVLCVSASAAVIRNKATVAVVLVRYPLNNDIKLVNTLTKLLNIQVNLFIDGKVISGNKEASINQALFTKLMTIDTQGELVNLAPGGSISEYARISSRAGEALAVFEARISSLEYVNTISSAFVAFSIIMLIATAIASLLGVTIAKSILVPLNILVDGVNRITSGDLNYEIMLNLKDEIGRLSNAFNDMRISLNDKINTIQSMNLDLENKISDRTHTIEELLNKMKKYLSPQLYENISGGGQSTSTRTHSRKKLTVFFSDIANFTSTTDSMEAEDLSELLNTYLDNMAKIALKYGGTIDKFVGDAIMVFFGDPEFTNDQDHALRASRMALEMIDRMKELREQWLQMGIERPLHIRIGINTGYCTVGNFGSENRMDYTIIGSNVNLASRLETAADQDSIYISHETYWLIHEQIQCESLGELTLKGFNHGIKAYKIIKDSGSAQKKPLYRIDGDTLKLPSLTIEKNGMSPEDKLRIMESLKKAIEYVDSNK